MHQRRAHRVPGAGDAGTSEMGLGGDEYEPLEVVAIYIVVVSKAWRYSQDRIDLFLVRFQTALCEIRRVPRQRSVIGREPPWRPVSTDPGRFRG
jgi:hypothetical protein